MTILVTGATGTVGRHVVDQLIEAGQRVRALTRNPAKANLPRPVEVVAGDLTKPATLEVALDGVTGMHLLNASGHDHTPLQTGPDIVALATQAGVRRVTVLAAGQNGPVEQAVAASDLEWTQVWPIDYMANTLGWAESIRTKGVVREPYGGRRTASVDEADVAAVVVAVLLKGGHAGKTYKISGPEALTPVDKVRVIGATIGRDLRFVELTNDQAREQWRKEGWPEEGIEFMLHMWASVPAAVGEVVPTVEQITGRLPRSFARWAAEHAAAFRS